MDYGLGYRNIQVNERVIVPLSKRGGCVIGFVRGSGRTLASLHTFRDFLHTRGWPGVPLPLPTLRRVTRGVTERRAPCVRSGSLP
jgi:hypothetical protein